MKHSAPTVEFIRAWLVEFGEKPTLARDLQHLRDCPFPRVENFIRSNRRRLGKALSELAREGAPIAIDGARFTVKRSRRDGKGFYALRESAASEGGDAGAVRWAPESEPWRAYDP